MATDPVGAPTARPRLLTLGVPRLEVSSSGRDATTVSASKQLALITYLAFAPRQSATKDSLCDLLWGDRDLNDARAQLRQTIWLIKRQVGESLVESTSAGVALVKAIDVDANAFAGHVQANRLENALELYNGEFFSGFASPGAGRFEEWVALERARLRSLLVHAAEALVRRALDKGLGADAIRVATHLRHHDPQGETGWRLLLESMVASGDTGGARAEASHFAAWLAQEERTPEPASAAALKLARTAPGDDGTEADDHLASELVGREREFSTIHNAWLRARQRGTQRILIVAESGLGKTRLLGDVFARLRATRHRVVYARANAGERYIPLSFVAGLAAGLAELPGARGVSTGAAAALVALNPTLSSTYTTSEHSTVGEPRQIGFAILELLTAVAEEHPVALMLDDLHWADSDSALVVALVASRLAAQRVLLVATARPRYAIPALPEDTVQLTLGELSPQQVEQLVSSIAALPDVAWAHDLIDSLVGSSRGVPLYTLEALRLCVDIGALSRVNGEWRCADERALATALKQDAVIGIRLRDLSESQRSLLRTLSIAAMPMPVPMAARAARMDQDEATGAAGNLETRGLLRSAAGSWEVAHDEIAAAVLSSSTPDAIASSHLTLGSVLAGSSDPEWRRRAIPHLAHGSDWQRAAAVSAMVLRSMSGMSGDINSRLHLLLGPQASPERVAKLRRALPTHLRYPWLRAASIVAVAVLLSVTALMASGRRSPPTSVGSVLVATQTTDNRWRQGVISLDREHWDATRPIVVDRGTQSTLTRYAPNMFRATTVLRPGGHTWATDVVSPDSGEGDIELRAANSAPQRLTWDRGQDRAQSFSPDGKHLLFLTTRWSASGKSSLAVLDMTTKAIRRLDRSSDTDERARWSPDGSRIGFTRTDHEGRQAFCTINYDGQREVCRTFLPWNLGVFSGWIDRSRILIQVDSGGTQRAVRADVDNGSQSLFQTALPQGEFVIDPSGRWLLGQIAANGRFGWYVAPLDRPDLSREILIDDISTAVAVSFSPESAASDYLDSLAIGSAHGPLAVGVPHQLQATAWTRSRARAHPVVAEWRSLTPSRATIDSVGVLIARDTGTVVVSASAGGWRSAHDTLRIVRIPTELVLDEQWDSTAFTRWRRFGEPLPVIVAAKDGARAFLNNGEGTFFSGAYLRNGIDVSNGVAMDVVLATPVTRTQWQVVIAALYAFSDDSLRGWDHKTGYVGRFADGNGRRRCDFIYPQGEDVHAPKRISVGYVSELMGDSTLRLDDGRWWRARLQLFPDGRCGIAINGTAVNIARTGGGDLGALHPLIQGSSVGTRMLVGRVRVWTGVPDDVDWTTLRFSGVDWRPDMSHRVRASLR